MDEHSGVEFNELGKVSDRVSELRKEASVRLKLAAFQLGTVAFLGSTVAIDPSELMSTESGGVGTAFMFSSVVLGSFFLASGVFTAIKSNQISHTADALEQQIVTANTRE